jgi:asparagine synthase (glutamine-hydrolysing)
VCGIVGIAGTRGDLVSASDVRRMCETIIHRGPDEEGIYVLGHVGLGMRRLSIIDLSGGRQPIFNEEHSVWVVFNGEIYNFPELRRQLEERGHRFYSRTDTEVIVHLYEELGADCVKKLRGMFAIALYDQKRDLLLLARDRMGKKPLHYALHGGRMLFASEIKAMLAVAPELAKVNPEAVAEFFAVGYIPDPNTVFSPIAKLPPGYLLEFQQGEVRLRQYWDLPSYGTSKMTSEEECVEELEHRLAEAVRIRLISDVPLGALLSGGVDSSVVVALMARASSTPVKTFSIGFSQQDFNEAEYARAVAETFGTEHHQLIVEAKVEETLDLLTRMQEEPFGDSSMIPTYYVSQMARQYVTVALSGDGGDELFAGYDRYLVHLDRKKYNHLPAWAGLGFRRFVYPWLPPAARGRRFLFNVSLPSRDRYIDSISFLPAALRERSMFSKDFLVWVGETRAGERTPLPAFQRYFDAPSAPDELSRLLYLDTKTYLTADVLAKVDRMSMAASLEVRSPLLDHEVVEWVAQLPAGLKLRNRVGKYLLRKVAERVGVPAKVMNRPKQGFAMPLMHWWRGELKNDLLQVLLEPRTLQRGYFDRKAVEGLVKEHLEGRRDRSAEIWLLLIFELWQRNFLEPRSLGSCRCPALADSDAANTQAAIRPKTAVSSS